MHLIPYTLETRKLSASSGNRTRAARVAGEHSTTEPTMLAHQSSVLPPPNWWESSVGGEGKKLLSQSVGFEPTLPEGNWFLVSRLNHSATTAPQERIVFVGMWLKLFGYLSTTLYLKWEKSTIFFIFLCLQIILTCKKQCRLSNQLAVVTVIYKSSSKFQDSVFIPQ